MTTVNKQIKRVAKEIYLAIVSETNKQTYINLPFKDIKRTIKQFIYNLNTEKPYILSKEIYNKITGRFIRYSKLQL